MNEFDIFSSALEINSAQARLQYLDDACGGDWESRKRVEALLRSSEHADSFMESPPVNLSPIIDQPSSEKSGSVIGAYKLLQQIGEGGLGAVYLAEQSRPVRRKVALKIIKPGMDTKDVIARFEAERQALALMDHPNIARVLDAGATESGRPYFVMELVKGVPLTEYCDKNHLSVQDRLKLFINVCHAIQHAHQKGVIHRDVKPTNIMVTLHDGKPVPKVIDFGVSKALSLQLTEKTLFTAYGQMMGTPAYMSPEQVEMSGLDIDTRSDIYSLGVLLYELLTGGTPFDAKLLGSAGFVEMQRIIREEDPPKPSTRLTTMDEDATIVSENRSTVPKKLGELIRGDLDWIVMKALEKERDRRYETANEFAADIERFLNDEPVTAYPPSTAYKFFKFVRRNKKTILTSVTLAVVLVLGTVVSTWQAFHATESKRVAKAEAAISTAVIDFINRDLLAQADPFREPDRDLTVRQALDRTSKKIKGRFQQQPLVEAAIRQTIGTTYLTLGEYGKAERHLKRAVKIRRRLLGTEHKKTIVSMMNLAVTIRELGRYAEAEKLQTNVLEIQRRVLGDEHPHTLASMLNLANAINAQGRYDEAEKNYRKLLRIQRRVLRAEHPKILKSMTNLASVVRLQGRHAEAEELCRKVLRIQYRVLRKEHPDTLNCMTILANAVLAQGDHAEAEKLHKDVLEIRRRVLGPEHPSALMTMNNLAIAIFAQGRYVETETLRREVQEIQRRVLGAEHPSTLKSMMNLANVMNARGNYAEAEKIHQEVFDVRQRVLGAEHPNTLASMLNLANAINAQGRHAEAEERYREVLRLHRRILGPEHPTTLGTMVNLAVAFHKQQRFAEAETLRREVLNTQSRVLGPEHPDTLVSLLNLANAINAQGDRAEAEKLYRDVLKKFQSTLGPEHPYTLKSLMALANVVDAQGHYSEAEEHFRRVLQIQRRVLGAKHPDTLYSMNALAWFLSVSAPPEQRNPEEAVGLSKETLSHQPDNGKYLRTLGQALYRAGDLHDAIQALNKSIEFRGPNQHDYLMLALVHWNLGHKDQARMLFEKTNGRKLNSKHLQQLHAEMATLLESENAPLRTGNTKD